MKITLIKYDFHFKKYTLQLIIIGAITVYCYAIKKPIKRDV